MGTIVPKSPFVISGVIFVLAITLVGIFAPLIAPYDPQDHQLRLRHVPPGSTGIAVDRTVSPPAEEERFFIFGTDHLGRDYLSRILLSIRSDTLRGAVSGVVALVLGTSGAGLFVALGIVPTAPGQGRSALVEILDYSSLRLAALVLVIGLPLTLIGSLILGPSSTSLVMLTAIFSAILPLSLIYQSIKFKLAPAQENLGQAPSTAWFALRIGLALAPVSFSLASLMSFFILFPVSFYGLGIQPPESSLGLLLSQGRQYIVTAWWVTLFPVTTFLIAVGAFLAITLPIRRVQKRTEAGLEHAPGAMNYAGVWVRMGSITVDTLTLIFIGIFSEALTDISIPLGLFVLALYFIYVFIYLGGYKSSLGHHLLRIRTVRSDGEPIGIGRSFMRGFLILGLSIIGVATIPFSRRRRALYYMLADTVVVRREGSKSGTDMAGGYPQCGA